MLKLVEALCSFVFGLAPHDGKKAEALCRQRMFRSDMPHRALARATVGRCYDESATPGMETAVVPQP